MTHAAESRPFLRSPWKLAVLLTLALLLSGGGWLAYQAYHVYTGIQRITSVGEPRFGSDQKTPIAPINGNQRFNVLVLGSDNDRKAEEARPLTQSMIVVTVTPRTNAVSLFSIPRDFWVPIRGHGYAKIDLAAKYGGIALARDTVERLFGIHIDYYAWVGLNGFRKVVDTFNGVTINVAHPILDDFYPDDQRPGDPYAFKRVFIPPGWRHLSGRQALEYVRSRHADAIGDFGRSERQQQLLLALRQKADVLNVLTNLPALVDDLQGSVRTDFSITQLYGLAKLARHVSTDSINRVVLQAPTYCTYSFRQGQSVLIPNWAAIRPVVRRTFFPPPAPKPAVKSTPVATSAARPPAAPATATPLPSATPTPVPLAQLPGTLVFERAGNIFQLKPDRELTQIYGQNAAAMPAVPANRKMLAFVRFSTSYASDIWTQPLTGGSAHAVTSDANPQVHQNLWAAWPAWSPDGKTILFASDRYKLPTPASETRQIDLAIYGMPASGGAPVQLTQPSKGAGGDTDPQWRPGHDQFMYVHWAYNPSTNVPYSQLIIRDVRDANQWVLTPPSGQLLQAAFSPSGRQIVFVRNVGSQSQIVIAALRQTAGGPQVGLERVLAQGEVAQPAIAPGGKWVSYLQADGDGFSLYLVPAVGGSPTRISEVGPNMDSISRPVWEQ